MIARILSALSGVMLLATAYLHSTGTPRVREVIGGTSIPDFFVQALPVQWLFFSWHLTILAVPLFWAAATKPDWFLPAALFFGAVVLGDFFWVYSVAGWFPGTIVLAGVVGLLSIAAALLFRETREARTLH